MKKGVYVENLYDHKCFLDENFESIEPHLITSSTNEQEEDVEEEGLSGDPNGDGEDGLNKYEIVQVLDNSSQQMFEMVYCDPPATQINSKKEKSYVCLYEGCGKMYSMAHQLDVSNLITHCSIMSLLSFLYEIFFVFFYI